MLLIRYVIWSLANNVTFLIFLVTFLLCLCFIMHLWFTVSVYQIIFVFFLIPYFKLCNWSVLLLLLLLQDGLTALHRAIICKKQAVTNYLLRESANPFVRDKVSITQQLSFETVVFKKTVAEHYVFSCFTIYLKVSDIWTRTVWSYLLFLGACPFWTRSRTCPCNCR